MDEKKPEELTFRALINDEEQYSLWRADRENPLGWRDAGKTGTREECLAFVKEVWTDMRPLSLRKAVDGEPEAGLAAAGNAGRQKAEPATRD